MSRFDDGSSRGMGLIGGVAGLGLIGVLGLSALWGSGFTVDQRERTVVTRNGAFSYIAQPGWHFKMPFIDDTIPVNLAKRYLEVAKLETFTTGAQPQHVDLTFVVEWIVPEANVERYYNNGANAEALLASLVTARAKNDVGRRHANELPGARADIEQAIMAVVVPEAMERYGVQVLDVRFQFFDYSPTFRKAVDDAAVAQQRQAQVETEAKTAEDQARGVANSQIQAARGRAESALLEAQSKAKATELQATAEAQSIRVRGEAEAGAIQAQARALGDNPNYIQLRMAERWSGVLPQYNFGGGSGPVPLLNLPMTPPALPSR